MSRRRAALVFLGVALLTGGCDHAVKQAARSALGDGAAHSLAGDLVRFELTHNSGGFLSFGSQLAPALRETLFVVLAPLLIAALLASTLRASLRSPAALAGLGDRRRARELARSARQRWRCYGLREPRLRAAAHGHLQPRRRRHNGRRRAVDLRALPRASRAP